MKRFLIVCSVLMIVIFSGSVFAEAAIKIGVVDFQQALNGVKDGQKAKSDLEAEFKRKQKQLDIQQQELEKLKNELQQQAAVIPQDKLKEKQNEFQQKFMDLRQKAGEYQQEMLKKESELSGKILGRLKGIVEDIGKKESFTLIVEKSNDPVLYVDSKEDLTSRVISLYNKKY